MFPLMIHRFSGQTRTDSVMDLFLSISMSRIKTIIESKPRNPINPWRGYNPTYMYIYNIWDIPIYCDNPTYIGLTNTRYHPGTQNPWHSIGSMNFRYIFSMRQIQKKSWLIIKFPIAIDALRKPTWQWFLSGTNNTRMYEEFITMGDSNLL